MNTDAAYKVDAYIEALPETEQVLMKKIRRLLLNTVPQIEERFSFGIPFYYYYGMFCFVSARNNGINVSFCRGKDLVNEFAQLEQKGRAIVASVTIKKLSDINFLELPVLIAAAAEWNKEAAKQKIPMVQKRKKP